MQAGYLVILLASDYRNLGDIFLGMHDRHRRDEHHDDEEQAMSQRD